MGSADGGDRRRPALCLRRGYNSAFEAVDGAGNDFRQRSGVYGYWSGDKNYEFMSAQNCTGCKKVYRLSSVYDSVCISDRDGYKFADIV